MRNWFSGLNWCIGIHLYPYIAKDFGSYIKSCAVMNYLYCYILIIYVFMLGLHFWTVVLFDWYTVLSIRKIIYIPEIRVMMYDFVDFYFKVAKNKTQGTALCKYGNNRHIYNDSDGTIKFSFVRSSLMNSVKHPQPTETPLTALE